MVAITALLGLGMVAQVVAWRLRLPSILLLLGTGFACGPSGLGWIDPDWILGEHLFPIVSLSVGIILFEGGLSLKLRELGEHRRVVWLLVTLGAAITWLLTALAAHYVLDLGWGLAILLGAILIVSGPTVVLPLLRHVKPRGPSRPILKWEGIVIDPVGAVMALLVFETLESGTLELAAPVAIAGLWNTILAGTLYGAAGALLLWTMLRNYWLPDGLQVPFTLAVVIASFTGANYMQHEAGLLAVTVMGVLLANQRSTRIDHILEWKENLRVLLISSLFVLLAARVDLATASSFDMRAVAFLAILLFVVRPAAVWACTTGSTLTLRDRIFLAWLCPRGIVAAAVASVFALSLEKSGSPGAEQLVPLTFFVIVGTVVVYGLTAGPLARRLGLAESDPQGVLFVGADGVVRAIATALKDLDVPVVLADTNQTNLRRARMEGLRVHRGNVLFEQEEDAPDLGGIGRVLAMTPNDEVNRLVMLHFVHDFGRRESYHLAASQARETESPTASIGRTVFGEGTTSGDLRRRFAAGATIKTTPLTAQFDLDSFLEEHGEKALVLFVVGPGGKVEVNAADGALEPKAGHTLVAMIPVASGLPAIA
jgi:NhaP-type Na+/H+ or K+/H+ antiporter